MSMTKAEKARMAALETELAFRWPNEAEPRPMTKADIEAVMVVLELRDTSVQATRKGAQGWIMNAYNGRVEKAWSNGSSHGRGNWSGDGGSQGMGQIYPTRRDAALAMRWEMCRDMAKKLRTVDLLLQEESA